MASPKAARRLIVNADDFGRSHSINQAVVRAHREGILTSASLMVNETASEEAAALARENPQLGVGLHLTLVCGSSASLPAEIPGLADPQGRFSDNPFSAGLRYFLRPSLRSQLAAEIAAQFAKFAALGLPLDHVNGHLHLHMHPAVLGILTHPAASCSRASPISAGSRPSSTSWTSCSPRSARALRFPPAGHQAHRPSFRPAAGQSG